MSVGIMRKMDKLGRIVIPKVYREFYRLNKNEEVYMVETKDGILITNPKYKVVEIEGEAR